MKRGLFITFEGPEGSGKTTQMKKLAALLQKYRIPHLTTREPGGSKLSTHLRRWILNRLDYDLSPEAELHLFLADRAQHVREVLRPALEKGKVVLCDRYSDSTLAYQGGGRGFSWDLLRRMNGNAAGGLVPDLTLYFDVPVATGLKRVGKRSRGKDRMEREVLGFHVRVLAAYRRIARAEPKRVILIDGRPGPDLVSEKVLGSLARSSRFFRELHPLSPS